MNTIDTMNSIKSQQVVEFLAAEREGEAPSEAPLEERFGAKLLSSLRRSRLTPWTPTIF